jgi:hypothetical protein
LTRLRAVDVFEGKDDPLTIVEHAEEPWRRNALREGRGDRGFDAVWCCLIRPGFDIHGLDEGAASVGEDQSRGEAWREAARAVVCRDDRPAGYPLDLNLNPYREPVP